MSTPRWSLPRGATLVAFLFAVGCSESDYVRLYHSEARAPSYTVEDVESMKHMGATFTDQGVNFALYSENATRLELLLFDDPEGNRPSRTYPLTRYGDVWNVYVEGVGLGQHYGFRAWGPNWEFDERWFPGSIHGFRADADVDGNRFNPNKLLTDPYSQALHRDHDWSKGSTASGPARTEVTYAASAKSVLVQSGYQWGEAERQWRDNRQNEQWAGHKWQDLIVYEVHAKGFTADPASGVRFPGTYRGLGEKADYFKDLGITAVELLPIHEKPLDGGYWGYQTINFFAPELSYAAFKRPNEVIDEFKWMVEELHKRDIEVIVDVVYNHTGEGGLWREKLESDDVLPGDPLDSLDPAEVAGVYSFRGIDNQAYYGLTGDRRLYWNNTGVGNQTRPNHRPMRKLIIDSLRFYTEELHVDGFRFDLAPILGERDQDYNRWDDPKNTVLQEIVDDPVLQKYNTRIIAEPWSAGGWYCMPMGEFPNSQTQPGNGWYEWNGRFRDWWRAFINRDDWKLNSNEGSLCGRPGSADGAFLMYGSKEWYSRNGRRPYHSMNFITVHDGFTMYDLFTYEVKQNKCGPLNPVCCDTPNSPFCDKVSGEDHNRSRNWGPVGDTRGESMRRQMMRNAFMAMMISHGTPMILGGDEWMRTQLGNNNAYSTRADNPFNWYQWGAYLARDERHRMYEFVKAAIRLRKEHAYAFAPSDYEKGSPLVWKSAQNTEEVGWDTKQLMMHYPDTSYGPELVVLINMEPRAVEFTLPPGRQWKRLIDTQAYFDSPEYLSATGLESRVTGNSWLDAPSPVTGVTYGVPERTIVVLRAE
ncbi:MULTISPECIES: glycogen debranching protein [Myxococcus]|uniref:glycogen debranching protein n=1 Tax=Myxococcus TaxID=32 RepID=UPI0013D269A2|nr:MULTISPECIES: alpha-amylase family glycosyl hydrolase [Myxococcus]NVJ21436.1 glycosyl hydrolase [Myxococcus sp. AM011]